MKPLSVLLTCVLLVFPLRVSAAALSPLLSMDEAAGLAVQAQPQIEAMNAQVVASRQSAIAASERPDPRLRFGVANLPIDTFEFSQEPMTQAIVGVTQVYPGGDKLRLAGERMQREASQRGVGVEAALHRVARDAKLAWLDVYLPEATLPLVMQLESEFQRQVEWSEVAYKTGKQTQDETLAIRGLQESVRDRVDELNRQVSRARANLVRWVGEAGNRPLGSLPESAKAPVLADLDAKLEHHPELSIMRAAEALADAEVAQARAAYKPDWSVDLAYGLRAGDRPDFLSLMVGVDLPLFPEKRQDRKLAAKLASVDSAQQQLSDRRRTLKAELQVALADWQSTDKRIERFENEILPLARRRVESALNAYGADKVNYGRVLEARRAELESRINLLNQQVAQARARVMINYLTEEHAP